MKYSSITWSVAAVALAAATTTTAFVMPRVVIVTPRTQSSNHEKMPILFAKKQQQQSDKDDKGVFIKSVLSKEIYFDEASGRFFETKQDDDDDDNDVGKEKSGFSLPQNPFQKPEGTFFQELFKKDKEAAPPPPPPPAPAKKDLELPSFSLPNLFETKKSVEETTTTAAAPPPRTAAPKQQKQQQPFSPPSMPSFFGNLFPSAPAESGLEEQLPAYERVVIAPDFRVAAVFVSTGLVLDQLPVLKFTLGPIVTLLGLLFLVQTFRIRFVFTETNELSLETVANPLTGETTGAGENIVVGGANVWACDSIVNYDFFPAIESSPIGPILVYFKETQTDSATWNEGPGKAANDPAKIAAGQAVAGQVHFFPAVCNSEQIRDEFAKRGCGKL